MVIKYLRDARGIPRIHPLCRNGEHMKWSRGHCIRCDAEGQRRNWLSAKARQASDPEAKARLDARNKKVYEKLRGTDEARIQDNLYRRLIRYGMRKADFEAMWSASNGRCNACSFAFSGPTDRRLNIDHCHSTGRVRAMLCQSCNTLEGFLRKADAQTLAFLLELSKSSA